MNIISTTVTLYTTTTYSFIIKWFLCNIYLQCYDDYDDILAPRNVSLYCLAGFYNYIWTQAMFAIMFNIACYTTGSAFPSYLYAIVSWNSAYCRL